LPSAISFVLKQKKQKIKSLNPFITKLRLLIPIKIRRGIERYISISIYLPRHFNDALSTAYKQTCFVDKIIQ
jgi:hypothetical protein